MVWFLIIFPKKIFEWGTNRFLHCFRSPDVEPEDSIKIPQTQTFTQISIVRIWIEETSLTEPTKLRNQSWDKRRRTIRKCQVVALEFVQTITLWLVSARALAFLCPALTTHRQTHSECSTLAFRQSVILVIRFADKIGRYKSTFISVCERPVSPVLLELWGRWCRSLWPGERRAELHQPSDWGEQNGSWIPESLQSWLSLRGGASQLRRAQGTFGPPGPWDRRIWRLTFNTWAVSSCHHLPRGLSCLLWTIQFS